MIKQIREKVKGQTQQFVDEWVEDRLSQDQLRDRVFRILDDAFVEVLYSRLGLERKFGRTELREGIVSNAITEGIIDVVADLKPAWKEVAGRLLIQHEGEIKTQIQERVRTELTQVVRSAVVDEIHCTLNELFEVDD